MTPTPVPPDSSIFAADRLLVAGRVRDDLGVVVNAKGMITGVEALSALPPPTLRFPGKLLAPGFVNAHSHAFQRLLRGRTQGVTAPVQGTETDTFWSWREVMYACARRLDPDGMRIAARQAFVEMVLDGTTAVGEFHYVHHQPNGEPYDDPVAMAEAVAQAALDAGLRLRLLPVVYLRGDFHQPPSELQRRFCDPNLDAAWDRSERTARRLDDLEPSELGRLHTGIAAHSVRALAPEAIGELKARAGALPFHIHASEQRREVQTCVDVTGRRPIALLHDQGVLDPHTTLVHATHLDPKEPALIGRAGATVCMCPGTEADLGDGLGPASDLAQAGVALALGTDGQTHSGILAEARRLETHERLRLERRNVLGDLSWGHSAGIPWAAATRGGARSLDLAGGEIEPGRFADFVTFDLGDPRIAGWDEESLIPSILFSADGRAIRDVVVGGALVVRDGHHPEAEASQHAFARLVADIFG